MPEGFLIREGNPIGLNDGQKMILEHWHRFWDFADREGVDTAVFNGDALHGQNPRERGIQLLTTDLDEQKGMFLELVRPHVKGRILHFISGSGYHKSVRAANPEFDLCRILNEHSDCRSATWHGPLAIGSFLPSELNWFISHGESMSFIYRGMVLDRENLHMNAAIGLGVIPPIKGVIHGHWHSFDVQIKHRIQQYHIQLPCWCAFVPWKGTMVLPFRFMGPDIGGVILKITEDEKVIIEPFLLDEVPKIADFVRML